MDFHLREWNIQALAGERAIDFLIHLVTHTASVRCISPYSEYDINRAFCQFDQAHEGCRLFQNFLIRRNQSITA